MHTHIHMCLHKHVHLPFEARRQPGVSLFRRFPSYLFVTECFTKTPSLPVQLVWSATGPADSPMSTPPTTTTTGTALRLPTQLICLATEPRKPPMCTSPALRQSWDYKHIPGRPGFLCAGDLTQVFLLAHQALSPLHHLPYSRTTYSKEQTSHCFSEISFP